MKKLLLLLLLGSSMMVSAHKEPSHQSELWEKSSSVILLENESVIVTGESYEYNGENYLKVRVTNKTSVTARYIFSILVNGEQQTISYDGTIESILTLDGHGTFVYGESKENNPMIEISKDWMSTTKVQLTHMQS